MKLFGLSFVIPRHFSGWVLCDCMGTGGRAGGLSSFLIFSITQILMDGFWNKFKGVYLRGHGRSLSFWGLLSRIMCPWLPWQILGKNCNFRDNLSSNGWISMKLCSCNVVRAWTLPFGYGPDICSYLPLAKFHGFCIFRDNASANQWISMKLYSCNVVRAWALPFDFGPDICPWPNFIDSAIFMIT